MVVKGQGGQSRVVVKGEGGQSCVVVKSATQAQGINTVIYFAPTIFTMVGFDAVRCYNIIYMIAVWARPPARG